MNIALVHDEDALAYHSLSEQEEQNNAADTVLLAQRTTAIRYKEKQWPFRTRVRNLKIAMDVCSPKPVILHQNLPVLVK